VVRTNSFGVFFRCFNDLSVDLEKRKDLFLDAFSARSGYATPSSQTPLAVLVKRLQESLTRMESFDVVTTSPGSMDGTLEVHL
jgi:E3 ubiquitin-protein ligase TRIP12